MNRQLNCLQPKKGLAFVAAQSEPDAGRWFAENHFNQTFGNTVRLP